MLTEPYLSDCKHTHTTLIAGVKCCVRCGVPLAKPVSEITDRAELERACQLVGLDTRWVVYVVRCADGSLYTGVTVDLERRLRQHNGKLSGGARYTRSRRPVTLEASWSGFDRSTAQKRESALKKLTRSQKLNAIAIRREWRHD